MRWNDFPPWLKFVVLTLWVFAGTFLARNNLFFFQGSADFGWFMSSWVVLGWLALECRTIFHRHSQVVGIGTIILVVLMLPHNILHGWHLEDFVWIALPLGAFIFGKCCGMRYIVATGLGCNSIAKLANGGSMPVTEGAAKKLLEQGYERTFADSPRFVRLIDGWSHEAWPGVVGLSIGDFIIVAGLLMIFFELYVIPYRSGLGEDGRKK